MPKTLYICGNGFDRHHDLHTAYTDYRDYLMMKHPEILHALSDLGYLYDTELWSNLEENLKIDFFDKLQDIVEEYYPHLAEDGDSKWSDVEAEVENVIRPISQFTTTYFFEWIKSVDVLSATRKCDIKFDAESFFITFNYTDTLQKLYGVKDSNVLHIHGSLQCVNNGVNEDVIHEMIQFGNNEIAQEETRDKYEKIYENDELRDAYLPRAIDHIVYVAKKLSKNVEDNMEKLAAFVHALADVDKVVVMGHCLNGIDMPYYIEVLVPMLRNCQWTIMVHSDYDRENARKFAESQKLNIAEVEW